DWLGNATDESAGWGMPAASPRASSSRSRVLGSPARSSDPSSDPSSTYPSARSPARASSRSWSSATPVSPSWRTMPQTCIQHTFRQRTRRRRAELSRSLHTRVHPMYVSYGRPGPQLRSREAELEPAEDAAEERQRGGVVARDEGGDLPDGGGARASASSSAVSAEPMPRRRCSSATANAISAPAPFRTSSASATGSGSPAT